MILELNFLGISEFEHRRILNFDLYNCDVFTLIRTLSGRSAKLFDFKWKVSAVWHQNVVILCE